MDHLTMPSTSENIAPNDGRVTEWDGQKAEVPMA